ncbi:response regulator transcription factor [Actinokineospora auranticolor]|uniref:Two-component system response regulator ResD n=1 Tax=Actinokineospora auranticolor TaxID=155976 RepID=A0A2S6GNL2_9PSEU|nr:response regulator transcription factor [Actinokineospora auranticolor]PPK66825.1 two-component system response regulator ResD [Actinokineospora auranticolor]
MESESESLPTARPVVILVEDEADLAAMSRDYLAREGFRVLPAADVRTGLRLVDSEEPDLVVLDLGLPDGNGLDLLRGLRGRDNPLPVIVVTGRGEEADRVVGLELGADDYLVKPYSLRELAARIRAVLRRSKPPAPPPTAIRVGGLEIDTGAREVRRAGEPIALTPREYGLIEFLASAPGQTFSREQLLDHVWGSSSRWQAATTVDEHVYRIRRKLVAAGVTVPKITTVRGFGYRLDS